MTATIVIATSLMAFLWRFVDHGLMLAWYLTIIALSLERIYYAVRGCVYGGRHSLELRYRRFRFEALATSVLWGVAAFVFYPQGHLEHELLLALIMMGMAGGGAINLAIDKTLANTYITVILSSLAVRFFWEGELLHIMLAFLIVVFMAVLLLSIQQLGRIMKKGIRQHHEIGELRQRLDLIAEQAPVGIFYFDRDFNVIDSNRALCEQIGLDKESLLQFNLRNLKDQRALKNVAKVLEEGEVVEYEGPYVTTTTGREMWVSTLFSPLRDSMGRIIGGIGVLQDKTVEHLAMEKAEFLAYHDGLTHLPNRKLLEDRYILQISQASREGYYSALLFLDLDRFKHINDTYGHNVGDEMLKSTARRLGKILRASDTLCRLGGDEFIIFLPMISKDPGEALEHTWQVGRKIHKALSEKFDLAGHQLYITTSIGAVLIYGKEEPLDEVLRKADIAMYHAKRKGQGVTSFYEEEMDRQLRRTIRMEENLRHAIDRDELFLQYQPIVEIEKGRIYGMEALLRWRMADGTLVSPAEFIPVAEESKLIHQIGRWVIEEVCRVLRALEEKGKLHFFYISVNISSKQFGRQGFFDEVTDLVRRYGIDPRMLKFEITETILMEEQTKAKELIAEFNKEGIGFMIDDFGTGYSSLSYLKQFDFETIKIDKSFIRDILVDEDDVALVRAILDIARQFGYTVIAEGVETGEQVERLREIDPSILAQGYYYSRPTDLEVLVKKMETMKEG